MNTVRVHRQFKRKVLERGNNAVVIGVFQLKMNISIEDQLFIETLTKLQKYLTYTVLVSLFIIGNIGCIFNTIIFLCPYLRRSSCSRYFLASSFANAFQLNIGLASHILDSAFSIHPYHYSSILCKCRNYLINTAGFLSQTYLLFACIDRYFITTRFRPMSRIPIANRIILCTTCFWLLDLSHMLIYSDITVDNQFCFFSSATYVLFISIHNFILSGFLLPILMTIFGLLTLKNIQNIRRQVHSRRHRNHYLSLMLVSNIFISVVFTLLYTSGLMYLAFFVKNRTVDLSMKEKFYRRFISFIAIIFYYVPYAISFYVNILTSQRFRSEFQKSCYLNGRKRIS